MRKHCHTVATVTTRSKHIKNTPHLPLRANIWVTFINLWGFHRPGVMPEGKPPSYGFIWRLSALCCTRFETIQDRPMRPELPWTPPANDAKKGDKIKWYTCKVLWKGGQARDDYLSTSRRHMTALRVLHHLGAALKTHTSLGLADVNLI